jgi:hypothetical protein
MTGLIEVMRQDCADDLPAISAEIKRTERAYAVAMLGLRRPFEAGSLTVLDARSWAAMVAAVAVYSRFTEVLNEGLVIANADEAKQLNNDIGQYAEQLRAAVSALVMAANERVAPADTRRNRKRRQRAQRRLADELRTATGQISEPS